MSRGMAQVCFAHVFCPLGYVPCIIRPAPLYSIWSKIFFFILPHVGVLSKELILEKFSMGYKLVCQKKVICVLRLWALG